MAKIRKFSKFQSYKVIQKFTPWLTNKTAGVRKLSKHYASRASRWGAPAGVALAVFILLSSFFFPKSPFQRAKDRLLRNPNDFQAQITLAEEFLENNQFEEAERALLLAQKVSSFQFPVSSSEKRVLGEQANTKLNELWQQKHYSDPKDIRRLIASWEKIIEEKPNYRDGYLQLAYLYYKIYENEKAKEYLQKALELDPNYEPARELERILRD